MMYKELQQYLILYRQLTVPGVGSFAVERRPADIDFANRLVNPPAFTISFQQQEATISRRMYSWLSAVLGISERDAIIRFNDFSFDIRNRIQQGDKLEWSGVGTLSKGLAGEIHFETALKEQAFGEPVPAVKVLRDKAEHTVRVGEEQKSSVEMLQRLMPPGAKKQPAWVIALIVALIAFIFIAVYFSVNGFSPSSAANQQKLKPASQQDTHRR